MNIRNLQEFSARQKQIDSQRNGDDIARFVKYQTQQLVEDGKLLRYSTSVADMKKLIVDTVINGAAGM